MSKLFDPFKKFLLVMNSSNQLTYLPIVAAGAWQNSVEIIEW